jgi:branched-subunit amino acid aminotransferase/4-amino-4-deoxychorismate lyase
MSESSIYRWTGSELQLLDYCDMADVSIGAADSWLVTEGRTLAIDLHRDRFEKAVEIAMLELALDADEVIPPREVEPFWAAALDAIPSVGDRFPRVELQLRSGAPLLVFSLRSAPTLTRSVRLATFDGPDPRTHSLIKGPDTEALLQARTSVQQRGAEEAVILSPDGFVAEGAYSAILWWRGNVLCAPSLDLDRVDSVTARSVIALATALGIDVYYESITPPELDECEIWAVSALHGIRIVTAWIDGPSPAEEPGRLATWRARLERLRRPIHAE